MFNEICVSIYQYYFILIYFWPERREVLKIWHVPSFIIIINGMDLGRGTFHIDIYYHSSISAVNNYDEGSSFIRYFWKINFTSYCIIYLYIIRRCVNSGDLIYSSADQTMKLILIAAFYSPLDEIFTLII